MHFHDDSIYQIRTGRNVIKDPTHVESNYSQLAMDPTGGMVVEYGYKGAGTKIASLASLRVMLNVRSDLAYFSLSRSYVRRCAANGGRWTSGLNLLWWAKQRLEWKPSLHLDDYRLQTDTSMERQNELAEWSILMLRLTFIADVGEHAKAAKHELGVLADFAEEAAGTASTNLSKLWRWIKNRAIPQLENVLSEKKYKRLLARVKTNDPIE